MTQPQPACNGAAEHGGRLKFYKDGKFILELARAREGERVAWVSVPRKTYWPPHAPSTPSANLQRTASLSVSDDNSSVQSSPWQRDHCWKQSAPRRGLSEELTGVYIRPAELPAALLSTPNARKKRRRPFDCTLVTLPNGAGIHFSNGTGNHSHDSDENESSPKSDTPLGDKKNVPSDKYIGLGRFKFFKQTCETVKHVTLKVYRKSRKSKKRKELRKIIDVLKEKTAVLVAATKIPATGFPKQEHAMVSPRKRFLRELEKVNLEDSNKRPKARISNAAPKAGPSNVKADSPTRSAGTPGHTNGNPPHVPRRETPTSKPVSNYSIHSLLSMSEESANSRSPESYAGRKTSLYNFTPQKTDSPISVHSPDLSPSPETAVERQRNVRPSYAYHSPGHSAHSTVSPRPPENYFYPEAYAASEDSSSLPYNSLYQPSPFIPPTFFNAAYPAYDPRTHPPVWVQYPHLPPGPWCPLSHPLVADRLPKEDTSSDLPLNLSKH